MYTIGTLTTSNVAASPIEYIKGMFVLVLSSTNAMIMPIMIKTIAMPNPILSFVLCASASAVGGIVAVVVAAAVIVGG
jgi:hypothetical protein